MQAAYGTFPFNTIAAEALTGDAVGMSSTQADDFISKWQVASQYNDPVTGLSATVFEAIDDSTKHLAIRGTEITGKDILADGLLVAGLPPILNPQFAALQSKLNDVWLNDPTILQGQSFSVSGHSLGGYLAAAVKQNYTQVTEAYLYSEMQNKASPTPMWSEFQVNNYGRKVCDLFTAGRTCRR